VHRDDKINIKNINDKIHYSTCPSTSAVSGK